MLEFIRGDVVSIAEDAAVISLGGVGVRVQMPVPDLAQLSGEVTVYTVLQIREEEVHLYGFATDRSRELFASLTSVSGVGPRLALAVLSFHKPDELERAIASGDADALALVSGVGKKTAQRIVLELRDKFGVLAEPALVGTTVRAAIVEVREGLKGLGYSTQEIQDALADLPPDGDAPTLLRHALRSLGRKEPAGAER
ncbi:MAG: Holliday junction branch migration protein RuvA [Actinomycetota bacterium]